VIFFEIDGVQVKTEGVE